MIRKLAKFLQLLTFPGSLRSLIRWRKFSFASFQIVHRLKEAGVAPRTIIDVGANVGQFAVAAENGFPDAAIHSIEPDSKTATILRRNVSPANAIRIQECAVGERDGDAVFFVNSDSQVSSLLALGQDRKQSFPGSVVVGERKVPLRRLDSIFSASELIGPILLKIDAQGYEDRVIAGAGGILPTVEWIIVEVSFAALYESEIDFEGMITLLRGHGFQFVRPLNYHFSDVTGEIIEMDALFRRRSS